jgi:hypothetical protein
MRARLLAIVFTMMLLASAARAQPGPLFISEHDWTFRVGGGCYGLYQEWSYGDPKYGGGRHTIIYFSRHEFVANMRAGWLIALVVVPLGATGAFLLVGRGGTRRN